MFDKEERDVACVLVVTVTGIKMHLHYHVFHAVCDYGCDDAVMLRCGSTCIFRQDVDNSSQIGAVISFIGWWIA